jgi:signal transduction histidine kinase
MTRLAYVPCLSPSGFIYYPNNENLNKCGAPHKVVTLSQSLPEFTVLPPSIIRRTTFGLLFAAVPFVAVISAIGVLSYQLTMANTWVNHTQEVIRAADDLLVDCLELALAERTFVASGQESFVLQVGMFRDLTDKHISRLRQLTTDNAHEQIMIAQLRFLVERETVFADEVVAVRKQSVQDALQLFIGDQPRANIARIRVLLDQIRENEEALLAGRTHDYESSRQGLVAAIACASILELLTLIYLFLSTRAFVRKQQQQTAALEAEIVERKRVEQDLVETTVNLQRSNEDLQQFAYVASHDLQEPLRAVAGFLTMIKKTYEGKLDEQADKWIGQAVEGAERMRTLIHGLLHYARIESRGQPLLSVDANMVVKHAIANMSTLIEETHAEIRADKLPEVLGDEDQLVQLFFNLIGNAIKYRSAKVPLITVSAQCANREWEFSVEDNGIGLDMQHSDKIFALFQRLHSRKDYEGVGIGLALCKRIIERHNGRIWVESEPAKGSTFHFTLPAAAGAIKESKA